MSGRIFTDEEREAAKHNRREARQRLADKASDTVDQLLAEVGEQREFPKCFADGEQRDVVTLWIR
jgi:hypothetical protein